MTETERVSRGLIDRTLPKAEWTHHAHLRAGLWHVMELGIDVLSEQLIALHGDRRLPLHHYSESKLFSPVARRSWVEPDLRPIQ